MQKYARFKIEYVGVLFLRTGETQPSWLPIMTQEASRKLIKIIETCVNSHKIHSHQLYANIVANTRYHRPKSYNVMALETMKDKSSTYCCMDGDNQVQYLVGNAHACGQNQDHFLLDFIN